MATHLHFDPLPPAKSLAHDAGISSNPIPKIARIKRAWLTILVIAVGIFVATALAPQASAAVGDVDPLFDPSPAPYPSGDFFGGGDFGAQIHALAFTHEDHLVFGGQFTALGSLTRNQFARIDREGNLLDGPSPEPSGEVEVNVFAVQPDGKILIGGTFVTVQGAARTRLARLNADGTLESTATFNTGTGFDNQIHGIAIQPDGKLVVVGSFTNVNGQTRNRIARLLPNGSLESTATFNPGSAADAEVRCVALQADGKILVGGNFLNFNGQARTRLVRLLPDGSMESAASFNIGSGLNNIVVGMVPQMDGKIVLCGEFLECNGVSSSNIARLNSDGRRDTAFNIGTGFVGDAVALALQVDGRILVGGQFSSFNGQARNGFVRLNPDGSLDETLAPVLQARNYFFQVFNVGMQSDGQVVIAGGFSAVNGIARNHLVRLQNDPVIDELAVTTPSSVSWRRGGSAPATTAVAFELSTNGGATWSQLGAGQYAAGTWSLSGLSLPTVGRIRARAHALCCGVLGSSLSLIQKEVPFSLTATPDLAVEAGAGQVLENGGKWRFSALAVGEPGTKSFTLRNFGSVDLSDIVASLDGPDASAFEIVTQPGTTLAGNGGTSIVEVRYVHTAAGHRKAFLRIASNDPDESPYVVALSAGDLSGNPALSGLGLSEGSLTPAFSGNILDYAVAVPNSTRRITVSASPVDPASTLTIQGSVATGWSASREVGLGVGMNQVAINVLPEDGGTARTYRLNVKRSGAAAGDVAAQFAPAIEMQQGAFQPSQAWTAAVQPDGKVVIGGRLVTVGGQTRNRFARLLAHGQVESVTTFDPGTAANNIANGVAIQADGKILLSGAFTTINGLTRNRIARIHANGAVEDTATFNPGTGADGSGCRMAIQQDGKVILFGDFTTVNGQARSRIARLNPDGTLESTATFNPGAGANGTVWTVAVQDDGKILIGGDFTTFDGQARNRLARLNANGSLESTATFNPGTGADQSVYALAVQADGRILVGGIFTTFSGVARNGLVRLEPSGANESTTTFNAPAVGTSGNGVLSLSLQADGKILAGGSFTAVGGQASKYLIRFQPNGTLDTSFAPSPDAVVRGVMLEKDGSILVAGDFNAIGPHSRIRLARLWNDPPVESLAVMNASQVAWLRGGSAPEVQQVNFDVSTDLGFSWIPLAAGTRIAGGWEASGIALPGAGWLRARGRVRGGYYNASSSLIESVVPYTGVNPVPEISVERPLGMVIEDGADQAFGSVSEGAGASLTFSIRNRGGAALTGLVVRLDGPDAESFSATEIPTASLAGLGDTTTFTVRFAPTTHGNKTANLHLSSNDEDENPFDLVLTGKGISINADLADLTLSRGTLTPAFSPSQLNYTTKVPYSTSSIAVTPGTALGLSSVKVNGTVLASGTASGLINLNVGANTITTLVTAEDGTTTRSYTLVVNRASLSQVTLDEGYVPNPVGNVFAMVVQPDGKVVVGGDFSEIGGMSRSRIARLDANGAADPGFTPAADDSVFSAALAADGKIYLGGRFTNVAGVVRNSLARLFADGTVDPGFDPNVSAAVFSSAVQTDGKLVAVGSFTAAGGVTRNRLARFGSDGSLDTGFNPDADADAYCVALQADGKIVVGGAFHSIGGTTRNGIVRLDASGIPEPGFNPNANGIVSSAAIQADGKIVIGGDFTSVGGVLRNRLARLNSDGSLDNTFDPDSNGVVKSLGLRADGKLLIAGGFTAVGGTARVGLARLTANGAVDLPFDSELNGDVDCLAVLADGGVLIGGSFTTVGGMARDRFARLDNDPATQSLAVPDFGRVRWLRGGAGPEAVRVGFELSTDGGSNWTSLGAGGRISGGWELSGLALPFVGQIRATARTSSGRYGGSSGLLQTVAEFSGIEPEIGVEQPAGTAIADGGSKDFGGLLVGTSTSLTFTIKNTGLSNLTGLRITIDGLNNGDFIISSEPTAPVASPTGSTTFTVQFTPTGSGVRTAALHLANNDSNENPYDINLTGVGASVSNPNGTSLSPLTQAEYFVGTDPGVGNGTALSLAGSDGLARDLADITIPVGSLPAGTHNVGARVRDEAGRWSNPLIRRFTVSSFTLAGGVDPSDPGAGTSFPKPAKLLQNAEYFVGIDPGEGNGSALSLAGSDGLARDLADITIPVGNLPAGTHQVGVRVRDEANRWSNPLIRRFTVSSFTLAGGVDPSDPNAGTSFPKPAKLLQNAEYFVGTDPGAGNGTPLSLSGSDGLARDLADITIPVGSLPAGTHNVGVRVRDEANRWSNPLIRRFTVSSFTLPGGVDPADPNAPNLFAKPVKPLTNAEYFVGADPGQGNGTPLVMPPDAAGVARDISAVAISLDMPPGSYDVGVRVKDESGRWSNPLKRRFNLYSQIVIASQRSGSKLVDLEYDLVYGPRNFTVKVLVSNDGGLTWTVPTGSVTGDVGTNVTPGRVKRIVWHAGEDWNNGFSENMKFRVIAYETAQDTPAGFAPIVPGSFTMGSPTGEPGRGADETERAVAMNKPFFLKTSEVTWSEWNAVRNQGAGYGYTDIAAGRNGFNGDASGNHPVTDVSWMDAVKWCNLKSEIEGKKPVYYSSPTFNPATVIRTEIPTVHAFWNAGGYRLPSEAEWEYACRAGTLTAFHSGGISDTITDPNLNLAGWYASNSAANTHLVRGKTANAKGLYDLHGNVREWCWDAHDDAGYAAGPQWDPVTSVDGAMRVLRGGSWNLPSAACRSAARTNSGRNSRGTDIGFRVALNYAGLTDLTTPNGIPVDSRDAAAGNLIAGMRPAVNGPIYTTLALPDGRILIAGDFTTVDGLTRRRLARLNADGSLDASFNPGADSAVYCAAVLPDGKILLGGDFSSVASGPADFIARIHPDGTLDPTFYPNVDYDVNCMVVQADGKILIGGDFNLVGGSLRNGVARLLADGALDAGFDPDADGQVLALAVHADGKILLGGAFTKLAGQVRNRLARVSADGTLDSGFTAGTDGNVSCLAVQANGQVLVGGGFSSLAGQPRNGLGRLSEAGVADPAFDPNVNGPVRSIALQADGRILLGGAFTTVAGAARKRLAALDAAGVLESPFALEFNGPIHSLSLLPTGRLMVGGSFGTVNGVTRQGMAWLDNGLASGTLTAMSGNRVRWERGGTTPEASQVAFEISTDGGGTWLPLGDGFRIGSGWERTGVNLPAQGQLRGRARIPTGTGNGSAALMSAVVGFSGLVTVPEIAVETAAGADLADGGSYNYGTVTLGATRSASLVIRNLGYGDLTRLTITKDGANPTDFQVTTAPQAPVHGPAGTTVLVITFNPGDSGIRSAAIHIDNNDTNEAPFDLTLTATSVVAGQLADAFDPAVNNTVNAIAVQPDGKVIIGGSFGAVGTQTRGRFARLNPDLSLESPTTFVAGSGTSVGGRVLAVAVQPDGKILLAGQFTTINAQLNNRLARLLPDGSLESTATFNTGTGSAAGANLTVQAMALQPDGKIVVAGEFTKFGGQNRSKIARLNPNGSLDTTFDPGSGANGTVNCVTLQPDGGILIGGVFTSFNGQPRLRLARLLPNGSLDPAFAPQADDKVSCLAVQADGKIVLGGLFTTINGVPRGRLARLLVNGEPEDVTTFDPGSGADGEVTCIVLQADGGILLGGAFQLINDEGRAGIARLYPNGTLETTITFQTDVGPDLPLRGLALRSDGSVIVGGDFTDYSGVAHGHLALLANQPAQDELVVTSSSRIDWNRGGTAVEIDATTFELSTDGGGSWQPLPAASRKSGGWELGGLTLPSSGRIRARGRSGGGLASSSAGLVEIVRSFVNAPVLATQPATSILTNSATMNATIVPNGSAQVRFEYGPTTAYGALTPLRILTGNSQVELAEPIAGLSGLYHFRVIAETSGGSYHGNDLSFVTAPEPPVAVTANPVAVTTSAATLVGAVNPRGRETTVHFEYGSTTLYGNVTPAQTLAAGNSAVEFTAPISGLAANATYHFRIVATSSGGTGTGADVPFQATSGGTPTAVPSVTTGGVSDVTPTTATLLGTVNPNGGFTNAFFEYGTSDSLGSTSPALGAGNGSVPANLSHPLSGLSPGTLYHYRLVASNSLGTTQGVTRTFTTRFLPPVVTTGNASPLGTTGARVSGTVRASGASAQVVLKWSTDGVNFSNSVGAVPSVVEGDVVSAVTADLTNLQQGVTYHFRFSAENSGGTGTGEAGSFAPAILSGLERQLPDAPPVATSSLTVSLVPAQLVSGWRLAGELQWRASGSTAIGLTEGDRVLEFRPVPGFIQPAPEAVTLVAGAPVAIERTYYDTAGSDTGSLTVILKPDTIAAGSVLAADRAQWRFAGEGDGQWRNTGTTVASLPVGAYLIECKPVSGRMTPPMAEVRVDAGTPVAPTLTYFLASDPVGVAPVMQPLATVAGDLTLPHAFVGQLRSNAGLGTGFVVKQRVVATAGHVVFDDGSLTFVTSLQWLFQRDHGSYEPTPQTPRGFYVFEGYEALRRSENSPGTSTPQSQNLDVAAIYFTENAGRAGAGGFGGFLASDTTTNEFLSSTALKSLVGYPVDGIPAAAQGRLHATPPAGFAFTPGFGRTHTTPAIRGTGGLSGGPLCVQHSNGNYYPAAIYLGGTAQTVVRAIDSEVIDLFNRAATSGNDGGNNTGGGVTHSGFTPLNTLSVYGSITVIIEPAAALDQGAGWRLSPETGYRDSGSMKDGLNPGNYILQFDSASGYLTPAPQPVTLSGGGLNTIRVTYLSNVNTAPTITALADRSAPLNSGAAVQSFVIGDTETAAGELALTVNSSNPALVPVGSLVIGGSGANRTLTATPVANRLGSATLTVTVSDGTLSGSSQFVLTVTGTPQEVWREVQFGAPGDTGNAADGADPDGDGKTNLDEYAAGTNPNDRGDYFRIQAATRTATSYTLTATGKAGRSYVLERSAAPGSGGWTFVGSVGPLGADGPLELSDPTPPARAGFYRLRVSVP